MATSDQSPVVICDAGPIIHLDELGCLDLLGDFPTVLLAETVWQEVAKNRPAALGHFPLKPHRIKDLGGEDPELSTLARALALDAGEEAALLLARQNSPSIFLTDDAAARLAAEQMGLPVHGTIGVVVRSVRRGQRVPEAAVAILQAIPVKSTLHIRPQLLDSIIARVKHEWGIDRILSG